jgi:hypothetical protein
MPRMSMFPNTVEDCLTYNIKSLVDKGYLSVYSAFDCTSTWSRNGSEFAKVSYQIFNSEDEAYIIFDYLFNNEPRKYRVDLVSKVSNLGKGKIYFFECIKTGKLCRKLYMKNGYFVHRTAYNNLMYSNQIESKKNRDLLRIFDKAFLKDEVYETRFKKYFKTHYKGKPTKRFLKTQRKIDLADSFDPHTLERLLLM